MSSIGKTKGVYIALCLLLFTCLSSSAASQIETTDSLLHAYHRASTTNKHKMAQQLIDFCLADDQLTPKELLLTPSMPADSIDFLVNYAVERFYYSKAYFAECLQHIGLALPLAENNNPELHAMLLCDRGYCLFKQGQLTQAATACQKAMQYCQQQGCTMQLARAYLYLAIVNYGIPQIDEAKRFVEKAIETDRSMGTNQNTHNILGIACEIYSYAGQTDLAVSYGEQAVKAARAIGYEEGVVNHLSQLSYAYNRQGDYVRGLATAQQAVEDVERMDVPDRNLLAISLEYVAYNLLDMKRGAEAVPVLLRAIDLESEVGNKRSVCYDYKALAEAYEPDEPRKAVAALRQYIRMADSIHNAALAEALGQANAELHNDELQEENGQLQQQNDQLQLISDSQRQQKRLITFIAFIVALFLLAVIIFMLYTNRQRSKTDKELQKSHEAFITNVTQEFRTPLTIIQGLSQQLQQNTEANKGARTATSKHDEASSQDRRFLRQLKELVLKNMESAKTDSKHLAPEMAMSETQFRRKISALTGTSAAKYIMMLRIEQAKLLLAQYPTVTIIETAYRTGFSDNAHFTRVFRRFTDMTPMQYIKSLEGNSEE